MFRKILITLLISLLPLGAALATATLPPTVIGGELLPGTQGTEAQPGIEQAIDQDIPGWFQNTFLSNIITTLIGWTAALAVVMIIVGAYQYLTAVGDEEQVKQGRKTIIFGLVGVALALLAFAIVQILINFDFSKADLLAADLKKEIDQVVPFYDSTGVNWDSQKNAEVTALPQSRFRDEFLPIIARIMIYGVGSVAFIVFFGAGAWLVIGWGEEESIKKAKKVIVMAITAMAFAAGSYILVKSLLEIDLKLPFS